MANKILTFSTSGFTGILGDFTITLNSLAPDAARQATFVDNTAGKFPSAQVFLAIKSGAAPTAGRVYEVYLLRGVKESGSFVYTDDNAGPSDAAITIENANLLGTIVVTADANKTFYGSFDTKFLGDLGDWWTIAIKNATNQSLNATTANVTASYNLKSPEVQ